MKSYRKELWFNIPGRRAFVNITSQVEACLRESGIRDGLLLCNAMHITASVFINDDESGLHDDYERWLERLAPHEPISQYLHIGIGKIRDERMITLSLQSVRTSGQPSCGNLPKLVGSVKRPELTPSAGTARTLPSLLSDSRFSGRRTL